MIGEPPEEGSEGPGRSANEGLAESSTCEMGVQVSRSDFAEVSAESVVWEGAPRNREDPEGIVQAKRDRTGGRERRVGPYPHGIGDTAEIQCGDDDGVSERQECSEDTPGTDEDKRNAVWPEYLGSGVLREHSGIG